MNQYVIAVLLIIALALVWSHRALVNYIGRSYSYYKILKSAGETNPWLGFIPFVQYIKIESATGKKAYRLDWLAPLVAVSSIVCAVSGFITIPFAGAIVGVCGFILGCYRVYIVGIWSQILNGNYDIISVILAMFGFDGIVLVWLTRKLN